MSKYKRLNRSFGGDVAVLVVLVLIGAFMAIPFIYSIVQSFKPVEEFFIFPPRFFARNPTLENYEMLFKLTGNLWVPLSRYIFNSLLVTVVVTSTQVIFASMAAFVLAKVNFPGNHLISATVVVSLLFTSSVTGVMQYILMAKMGMVNTYFALILPYIGAPFGLFLMQQFMRQIPNSIIEAARIDGAGLFRIYWEVVMPAVKPAWLTLIIFSFKDSWNITATQFIYKESLKTLPTVMSQITASGLARAGVGAAAAVILMIPPLVTFVITQSSVLETMAHSGIKE